MIEKKTTAESTVKNIRRKTRKKYSAEKKISKSFWKAYGEKAQ